MKKLSLVLIVAGIIVMMVPAAGYLKNIYRQSKLDRDWEKLINSDIEYNQPEETRPELAIDEYEALGEIFTGTEPETTENINEEETETVLGTEHDETQIAVETSAEENKEKEQIILGKISIEKIDKELYIVEGVTTEDLRLGTGHIPGTAMIGQIGNCAIAGHRNYTYGKYFNRLNEVEIGDEIVINTPNEKYTYTVFRTLIVDPEDTWVLKGDGDRKLLTLITCEPVVIATHRLIVQAEMN